MIVEMRTYTLRAAGIGEFLKTYRAQAWPLQQRHLGHCVGWYTAQDGGVLNQVVHLWTFDSQADREARYAALAADPGWKEYLRLSGEQGHLITAENRLLRPTSFFNAMSAEGSSDV